MSFIKYFANKSSNKILKDTNLTYSIKKNFLFKNYTTWGTDELEIVIISNISSRFVKKQQIQAFEK